MPAITYGFQLFFGNVEPDKRPQLPTGFTANYSPGEFAVATSPEGLEYFIGSGALYRKKSNVLGAYIDETEFIPLSQCPPVAS